MIFQSCVYEWQHHICRVFNTPYKTWDCFAALIELYFQSLPRFYIDISDVLPNGKKNGITVNVLRLVRQLRPFSGYCP